MDPFVSQLAALCREYPTRNKWVFVQSHAVGRTLGERIALEGTNWANLRFVTPLDLAVRMAGPFLVEQGIAPSEDGLGPALIMRLLIGLSDDHTYFRPLAEQPSMALALWSTIRELRMAGIHAREIESKAAAFESPDKHAELVALIQAYEQYLADHKIADIPAVYEHAPRNFAYCPIVPGDLWTEHPDAVWAPLQRQLLDTLPADRIRVAPRVLACAGLPQPRRWSVLKRQLDPTPPAASADAERLAFLMRPADAPPPLKDTSISIFRAGGREAEIDEVFRRIVSSGAPLDQVEIACASDGYATVIWEKALRLDWTVSIATGIPATLTRPGRALLAWCDWIEGGFAAVDLRHLFQSGDFTFKEAAAPTPGRAARLLARAEATWGRATYRLALTRLAKEYERRAQDPERSEELRTIARASKAETDVLIASIDELLAPVPNPDTDGRVPLRTLSSAAEKFVDRFCACSNALDGFARQLLLEALAELHALDLFECSLPQALGFIRERVESVSVAPDRPRPGALHISRLSQAAYAGRPHLFIVGLEEGHVFPSRAEDPVLLDAERRGISDRLRLADDRVDELQHQIVTRLGSAAVEKGHVSFSYSCRDTRQYRETLPSWLLLQVGRIAAGDASLDYAGLEKLLGEPRSSVPPTLGDAVTQSGWWLSGLKDAGAGGRAAVLGHFPALARGAEAEEKRTSDLFTEFDGFAAPVGKVIDPVTSGRPVSATTLEAAAACPYRFFIEHGLGVQPVGDVERERDAWLDPLTRGSELHDLFARLLRRCRDEARRPDVKKDAWILKVADTRLETLRVEAPPPSEEVFEREREEFLRDVQLFLEYEASYTHGEPVGLEVGFGRRPEGDGDEAEPLSSSEPMFIDLGDGRKFQLRGRIDRIDKVGPFRYEVIDYKTGGYWKDDWRGTFAGGTRLQHALYGLAAVQLLRAKVDKKAIVQSGVYFFPAARGGRKRVPIPAPSRAKSLEVVGDVLEVIRKGIFIHAVDEDSCEYCDFSAACGPRAVTRAKTKLANAGEKKLDAYRRMQGHD